ncbi:MAG: energy-coupling factor transporter ATPase [Oscillospiraceae bacterium]|jgi:energy-coupling factor transport system ATP-binding protein|nr:energy-coupling factor transporter ATPase [Oscillospiraceae bacterium]
MTNKPIIEFKNVSFRYDSEDETLLPLAVKDVNLTIRQGELVAVLGHNGSGKSTLAKLSNAILLPAEGQVLVNGMDSQDEALEYDIRKTVGVVFQNPDNQIVASIVEEDVAFGPENLGVPPAEIRKRVDDALRAVNMYDYRHHEPHKLSGGQKQRVAIAGIIAMLTACIVFDEPTAMLDPSGRKEVMQTIQKLNREMGKTVVYITHFMDEAVEADRIVVMDDGKILFDGTPREVFARAGELKAVGLDVPVSAELAGLLKADGVELPNDVLTVSEFVSAFQKAALK